MVLNSLKVWYSIAIAISVPYYSRKANKFATIKTEDWYSIAVAISVPYYSRKANKFATIVAQKKHPLSKTFFKVMY
ncbi:hypothetical protein BT3372_11962 [Brochothrix thermosphacta]